MLEAALSQGDWKIERRTLGNSILLPPLDILDFDITPFTTGRVFLRIALKNESGPERIKEEVRRVFIEGQFGTSQDEPREFQVSFRDLPKEVLSRARRWCDGYWRQIGLRKCVGITFVRDKNAPPGWPLYKSQFHSSPYGFEEHLRRYGLGDNLLRTARIAQPQALKVGDVLATGDKVLSLPRRGFNGSVLIHLTGGLDGHWIDVASRLPIALLTKEDGAPEQMWHLDEK